MSRGGTHSKKGLLNSGVGLEKDSNEATLAVGSSDVF